MKKGIHPEYHKKAVVRCACGNEIIVGSTLAEIKVEVCSKCHPFYTGEQRILDTSGRVDKFKKKYADFYKKLEKENKK
ncbi:50S ribosomal protein L31 [Thermodesulfatator atlanticus]|uniref:50S ribosomal protein L31 n=1 Tax=Thermodesulfatator atlanticus TaxID=501497 RepID=UPI0003B5640C|nr:50S ribosomal protein L31 [Thermodesulfatator atlanticus]